MSRQLRLTPAAREDLSEIWDYTEETWGVTQAEKYLGELQSAMERLVDDPDRGRACDEIRQGYRRFAIERHLIFYIAHSGSLDVIRVLHQRMDPGLHM